MNNNYVQHQSAEQALHEWTMQQFAEILPALIHGRAYYLRTLCGEDLWLQMDHRQRRVVGQLLEQLIAHERLDLRIAYAEAGSQKLYQLK